ncbi:MAG: exosortase/archaeosortase family protein, partial [Euryarchaeota archaeon]|nr:exosortase/archaeosortase family protein [Euryarchaeota archaeon]
SSTRDSLVYFPSSTNPVPVPEFPILGSLASALATFAVYLRNSLKKIKKKIIEFTRLVEAKWLIALKQGIIVYYKFLTIAAVVAIAYHKDFIALWHEILLNDYARYILIVPIVATYLVYRKRAALKAVAQLSKDPSLPQDLIGLALCLFAFTLYFYGTFSLLQLQLHILSLIMFIIGCIVLFLGFEGLRALAFPIGYLTLMCPLPLSFIVLLAATSIAISASVTVFVLRALGIPLMLSTSQGAYIVNLVSRAGEPLSFIVGLPCAGIYSLLGFIAFGVFLAYIIKGSLIKKISIFVAGCLIVYLLNIIRICAIIGIGYLYGNGFAVEAFHLFGGWVITVTAAFIVIALSIIKSPKISTQAIDRIASIIPKPKVSGVRIVFKATALSVILLLFLFASVPLIIVPKLDPAYVARYTPEGKDAELLLPANFSGWRLTYVEPISGYYQSLNAHIYAYEKIAPGSIDNKMVTVYVETAPTSPLLHIVGGWLACLPVTQGWKLDARWSKMLAESPLLRGDVLVFNTPLRQTPVVFTFTDQIFLKTDTAPGARAVGLSLLAYTETFASKGIISDPSDYQAVADILVELGKAIVTHWQQIKGQSIPIAFVYTLYYNIGPAIVFLAILLAVLAAIVAIHSERRTNRLRLLQRHLSENENTVLDLITAHKNMPPSYLNDHNVLKALESLENKGLIKRHLMLGDSPSLIWNSALPSLQFNPFSRSIDKLKVIWFVIKESKISLAGLTLLGSCSLTMAIALSKWSTTWAIVTVVFIMMGIILLGHGFESYLPSKVATRLILSPLLSLGNLLKKTNLGVKDQSTIPDNEALVQSVGSESLTNIERELGTGLQGVGIDYLIDALPPVLKDGIEIADEVKITKNGSDSVEIIVGGSRFSEVCQQLADAKSSICDLTGCPICSALALAIAKATGRQVSLERHEHNSEKNTTILSFKLGEIIKLPFSIIPELSKKLEYAKKQEKIREFVWYLRKKKRFLPGLALLILSAIATITAFVFGSVSSEFTVISAFAIGFILLYFAIEMYTRSALTSQGIVSSLNAFCHLFQEIGVIGKGIYLPTGKILVPTKGGELVVTPIGENLYNIIKSELGKENISLEEFIDRLPSILVDKLDLATEVYAHQEDDTVHVKLKGSKLSYVCDSVSKTKPSICEIIGCPLCSAIAMAITSITSKPLKIEKSNYDIFKDETDLYFKLIIN